MIDRLAPILLFVAAVTTACVSDNLSPADFDAAHEPCRFCRMTGSNGRSAAQLVAPREEPLFFDDIGCLRGYLKQADHLLSNANGAPPPFASTSTRSAPRSGRAAGAVVYVADHRTGAWIVGDRAVYTHNDAIPTPMSSHLLAHESAASRDADRDARGGRSLSTDDVFAGVPVPWSHDK